jgi:hypothetical protein
VPVSRAASRRRRGNLWFWSDPEGILKSAVSGGSTGISVASLLLWPVHGATGHWGVHVRRGPVLRTREVLHEIAEICCVRARHSPLTRPRTPLVSPHGASPGPLGLAVRQVAGRSLGHSCWRNLLVRRVGSASGNLP